MSKRKRDRSRRNTSKSRMRKKKPEEEDEKEGVKGGEKSKNKIVWWSVKNTATFEHCLTY